MDKYVTISINKKSVEDARTYFARVGADLIAHFARLGSISCGRSRFALRPFSTTLPILRKPQSQSRSTATPIIKHSVM